MMRSDVGYRTGALVVCPRGFQSEGAFKSNFATLVLPKAKAAAIKALELDSTLGEAHNSLAFCLDGLDWDFDSGRKRIPPGY
jgi:hypothetical protein